MVHAEVLCRTCSYVLRGLRGRGKCPECGTDVWGSILRTVDPLAQGLPRLSNPRKVGNGLVVLTICMFLSGLFAAFMAASDEVPGGWNWYWWIHNLFQHGLGGYAGIMVHFIFVLAAMGAARSLWPKSKSGIRAVKRDVLLVIMGLAGWGISVILIHGWGPSLLGAQGDLSMELAELLGVCGVGMVFLGLRGILGVIGQRSFAYRSSQNGKQSLGAMVAALVAGLIGELMVEIVRFLPSMTISPPVADRLDAVGAVVTSVCIGMLLIGMGYLVMNAWWVRQAILRPHRTLDDILYVPSQDETILGEDETRFEVSVKKDIGGTPSRMQGE